MLTIINFGKTVVTLSFTDLGLILDILGAVLLFLFGLAPKISRDGTIFLSLGESQSERSKARLYDRLATLGIILLFLGFTFQLLGNHVNNISETAFNLILLLLLSSILVFVSAGTVGKLYRTPKIKFIGQYSPQFAKDSPNYQQHLWQFEIVNTTKNRIAAAELQLPYSVDKIVEFRRGYGIKQHEDVGVVEIKNIDPGKRIILRIWNMGSGTGTGDDTYLVLGNKIVKPKIMKTLDL